MLQTHNLMEVKMTEKKKNQVARKTSKVVLAILGITAAMGFVPAPIVNIIGPEIAQGIGAVVGIGSSLMLGKDVNLKQIADQIGVNFDEVEDKLKKKEMKNLLKK